MTIRTRACQPAAALPAGSGAVHSSARQVAKSRGAELATAYRGWLASRFASSRLSSVPTPGRGPAPSRRRQWAVRCGCLAASHLLRGWEGRLAPTLNLCTLPSLPGFGLSNQHSPQESAPFRRKDRSRSAPSTSSPCQLLLSTPAPRRTTIASDALDAPTLPRAALVAGVDVGSESSDTDATYGDCGAAPLLLEPCAVLLCGADLKSASSRARARARTRWKRPRHRPGSSGRRASDSGQDALVRGRSVSSA